MSGARRWWLLAAWLAVLAAGSWYAGQALRVGTDLRLFMPTPQTAAERLLMEQIGEGPASRLLLLAIEGDAPEALAASSQALLAALQDDARFRLLANGERSLDAIPESLIAYRYLLSDRFDGAPLDAALLRHELGQRVQDLSSPAATLLEEWLPRDPTLEVLALAERWSPAREAHRAFEVWFSADERAALLVVETVAAGFDPEGQRAAIGALREAFASTRTNPMQTLLVSGPGAFSVLMQRTTTREATTLGMLATIGMLLLLVLAYRNWQPVLLGALPLLSAALAGVAAVATVFDAVHGITLAFGFTLIGVAQDYPMHLFSHQRPGLAPADNARALWPTLATGVASTCIAYAAFAVSGVVGLAQLGCFTISGLAAASLTTRFLLPPLIGPGLADPVGWPWLQRINAALSRWRMPRGLTPTLAALALAVLLFAPGPLWENNLGALTPLPPEALRRDIELRAQLGAPDVRYLVSVEGADEQAVLAQERLLGPALDVLVATDAIAGYDQAARYLPPRDVQLARRAALPDEAQLAAALTAATAGLPFKPDVFEPFRADIAAARSLPALDAQALDGTPLALRVGSLLLHREQRWIGLVTLTGVQQPAALSTLESVAGANAKVLDLKQASETLVERYRQRILSSLALAALALVVVVAIALRSARRVWRVLLPMALTTLAILAILHGCGIALSLFHLIALVLAAGLGLDYALFFEHAADDAADQARTLHAVLVCSLSTLMVFALLATSSLPVLRAIGLTVTLGVIGNFVLALILTRADRGASHA